MSHTEIAEGAERDGFYRSREGPTGKKVWLAVSVNSVGSSEAGVI
jgi:hypothetical protein